MMGGVYNVIYARDSVGCGWDGSPGYMSRGPVQEDAFKIGANIIFYALTH